MSKNNTLFHIVLHNPQIASNTGAIIRLCANTGCTLHLIEPIHFDLDDKKLRRAGLDYHEYAELSTWQNLEQCLDTIKPNGCSFFSTKATTIYTKAPYSKNHCLIFGSETQGLPADFMTDYGAKNYYKLPMQAQSRSLNLANTVSIATYEGWRQCNFDGSNESSKSPPLQDYSIIKGL